MIISTNHFQTSYTTLHSIILFVEGELIHILWGYSINYKLVCGESLSFTYDLIRFVQPSVPCILILQD